MNKARIVILLLFVAVLCFVLGNSLLPSEVSNGMSDTVQGFLFKIFGSFAVNGSLGGIPVRKIAHFVEFTALGVVTSLLLRAFVSEWKLRISIEAFIGVMIPIVDETIQIFSKRGSSLKDVWIDLAGYVFGCALVYLFVFVVKKVKNKSEKRP